MTPGRRDLTILLALFALIAAACGSSESEATPPSETRLVVYSGRGEQLIEVLVEEFTEETGIQVDVRYGGSTELAATLLEEGQNSPADVFFAQDPASLGSVASLMVPLSEDILGRVPSGFQDSEEIGRASCRERV